MKTVYDRSGRMLGRFNEGSNTQYYDAHGRTIGRESSSGSQSTLYDGHGRVIARFSCNTTYDEHGRRLGSGNMFLKILYPDMARIS